MNKLIRPVCWAIGHPLEYEQSGERWINDSVIVSTYTRYCGRCGFWIGNEMKFRPALGIRIIWDWQFKFTNGLEYGYISARIPGYEFYLDIWW